MIQPAKVEFALRTVSGMNVREHWRVRAKRVRQERLATGLAIAKLRCPVPCVITLTRLSPGTLDDDNLQAAFKAVRDAVAAHIGIDDGDHRIQWEYAQEKAKSFGVRIEVAE